MTSFRFRNVFTKEALDVIVHNSHSSSGDSTTVSIGKEKYFFRGLTLTGLVKEPILINYDPNKTGKILRLEIGFTRALNSFTGWFTLKANGQSYDDIQLFYDDSSSTSK